MIILYRLIGGLWQALNQAPVTPPAPPATNTGFGRTPFGTGPFGG